MKYTAPYRWNKPLKQNMDEHFNCSENLIVYKKKKKSTTDYITRNSKFKPHCQHKEVRKKVIEVGFFSAEGGGGVTIPNSQIKSTSNVL